MSTVRIVIEVPVTQSWWMPWIEPAWTEAMSSSVLFVDRPAGAQDPGNVGIDEEPPAARLTTRTSRDDGACAAQSAAAGNRSSIASTDGESDAHRRR